MKWKSIMQKVPDRSYLSGRRGVLHRHHCIHGVNRSKADKDGLYVMLTVDEHRALHDKGDHDAELKKDAERAWIAHYGSIEDFRTRYHVNYL